MADMEEQTEAVFKSSRNMAEGGDAGDTPEVGEAPDTTVGVDPVSGNEIPMGSTAAEVRDDIPAQLSEGEYVVPADVVRFYGVKFFEELRTEAKQGFTEMAENGRIGGEPVETDGMEIIEPEDDLPFDITELQMMDDDEVEMDEGGYLSKARSRAEQDKPINRFEQFLQWLLKDEDEYGENPIDRYAKEQEGKGIDWNFMGDAYERGQRKFNVGGYNYGIMFNPAGGGGMAGGFEIKEYVGPNGDSLFIQFMNGRPMSYIPEGYKLKGTAQEEVATPETGVDSGTVAPISSSDDEPMSSVEAQQQQSEEQIVNYAQMGTEDLQSSIDNLGKGNKLLGLGAGLLGGPIIGTAASIGLGSSTRNKAYDILDGIAYQLEQNPDEAQRATLLKQQEQVQAFLKPEEREDGVATSLLKDSGIYGGSTSLYAQLGDYGGAVDTDIDGDEVVVGDGRVTFGDTWLGDLLGADGKAGVQGPGLSDSIAGARRTGEHWEDEGVPEKGAAQIPGGAASRSDDDDDKPTTSVSLPTDTPEFKSAVDSAVADAVGYNEDPSKDVESIRTQNVVNRTDSAVTIGQVSAGGQDAGDGFVWEKKPGTNVLTRTWVGTDSSNDNDNDNDSSSTPSSTGSSGGCFLTTAIVDRRGEADDGPTLTKLRNFRDTYMAAIPSDVEEYYRVAPQIVASIPEDHKDWDWIGSQVDKSVEFIENNLLDDAYKTYKAMVKKLERDWLINRT